MRVLVVALQGQGKHAEAEQVKEKALHVAEKMKEPERAEQLAALA